MSRMASALVKSGEGLSDPFQRNWPMRAEELHTFVWLLWPSTPQPASVLNM